MQDKHRATPQYGKMPKCAHCKKKQYIIDCINEVIAVEKVMDYLINENVHGILLDEQH